MFSIKVTEAVNGYILEWKSENMLEKDESPRHEVFETAAKMQLRLVEIVKQETSIEQAN